MAVSLAIAGVGIAASSAHAGTINWSANAVDGNWTNGANWIGGVAPAAGDVASFDQTSYTNQPTSGTATIGGLAIGDGTTGTAGLTIAANQLTLGSGGILMGGNAASTNIASAILLNSNQSWIDYSGNSLSVSGNVTLGSRTTTNSISLNSNQWTTTNLSGVIQDPAVLVGTGAPLSIDNFGDSNNGRTIAISGVNTFSGGVNLNAGTLQVYNNSALGTGTLTINGGTIGGNNNTLANPVVINSDFAIAGASNSLTLNGPVTLTASHSIFATNAFLNLNGPISDSGGSNFGLTFNLGDYNTNFTLAGSNTFDGGVTFNSIGNYDFGYVNLNNPSALGTGTFTINAPTGTSSTVAINTYTGSSLVLSTNNSQVWNGDFFFYGSNNLNLGTGPVNLGATGTSSTRTITVNQNTLTVGGAISNGTNGATNSITKDGNGTLALTGASTYTGGITVNGGTVAGTTGSLRGNITLNNNSTLVFDQTLPATPIASGTYAGVISGSGNVTKNNAGTVIFTGANQYNGTTTINGGTLQVNANLGGSLPSGSPLTLGGGTLSVLGSASGGTTQNLGAVTLDGLAATSGLAVDGNTGSGTTVNLGSITANMGAGLNITTAHVASVTTSQSNTNGILDGHVVLNGSDFAANDGNGNIVAATYTPLTAGGGTDNNNSLITDSVTLNGVTTTNSLKITDTQGGQALTVGGGGNIILGSGGVLFTGSHDYTIAASDNAYLDSNTHDIVFNQYGTGILTVEMNFRDYGNNYPVTSVTKNGPGTLVLAPTWTSSWYNGNGAFTYINQGTLQMGNHNALGGDNTGLFVAAGATLDMNGNSNDNNNWFVSNVQSAGTIDTTAVGGNSTLNVRYGNISGPIQNSQGSLALNVPDGWGNTLTLTGSNSYSGGTTIADVTLAGTTNGLQGNITGNALSGTPNPTVVFDQTLGSTPIASGTYSGVISGVASVVKNSVGTVTLTGSNVYTGATTINGGTLAINGALPNSTVTINSGTLGGTGTVTSAVLAGGSASMNGGTITNLTATTGGTVGPKTIVSNATFPTGTVNFNSTEVTNGTLTVPAGTAWVVVGPGATVGTADFSAGAGTVNAINPLAVTNTLKVGSSTFTLTGGTSFTAAGSNITTTATLSQLTLSGGTLTIPTSTHHIQTFSSPGTSTSWTDPAGVSNVRYLIVGGGGGGGGSDYANWGAGGGGAGGLITGTDNVTPGTAYTVIVGAGGTGGAISGSQDGANGSLSQFDTLFAGGGGGGGGYQKSGLPGSNAATVGGSGGGSGRDFGGTNNGQAGTPTADNSTSFSNAGGAGTNGSWEAAGGGGGAGSTGYNGEYDQYSVSATCSQGGSGVSSDISGTTTWYAGGGGGFTSQRPGLGGSGVGGNSGNVGQNGLPGVATSGSGGGGGGQNPGAGGNGGSGVVILAYDAAAGSNLPNTSVATTSSSTLDLGSTSGVNTLAGLELAAGTATTALTIQDAASVTLDGDMNGNAIAATGTTGKTASILAGSGTPSLIIAAGQNISVATGVGLTVAASISGSSAVTKIGAGALTLSGSDSYTGGTNVSAGTLTLASANAFPTNSSLAVASGALTTIANHGSNATYVPVLSVLNNSGTLDITNNALVVHNGSFGTISSEMQQGYASGTWAGTSSTGGVITSSLAATSSRHLTAVGVATGLSSFEGSSVLPSDVLVKYTYYGDTNLDGKVDGSDYSRIDNSFLSEIGHSSISGWSNGDFNYDGVVNGSDYTLIDNAFNSQGTQLAAEIATPTAQIAGGSSSSAVPEPTLLGMLGISAVGLLGRRRRH